MMKVTTNDYLRLMELIGIARLEPKHSAMTEELLAVLKGAKQVEQEDLSHDVITMNSRVLLKELTAGRENEVTISYPVDADPREKKVSVFSPVGVALLGRQEGDIVSWRIPGGIGRFKILKVTYQPEAAGDLAL